ncbi:regulatory protein RecX [Candidatus Aerophobetes bacterium]|uniref:Regulatory protein RecX n=1 Tax=Aerophobetes bacterium TaxID=2030807 RepID=A0A523Y2C5_UNCAE|nr:MAG: regulatory protein RecX [Candidatus Aerophobetes bacterium]
MKQKTDLLKKEDKRNLNRAREYALRLLEYRERSEQEIKERMARKNYNERLIKSTIKSLKNHNLVNDRRFARMWAESCLRRSYGRWKVQSDLNKKGIDEEIVEEVLRESYSKVDEVQIALALIQKKWPFLKEEKNTLLRRVSDFLKRRGFPFEVIAEVIRQQYG